MIVLDASAALELLLNTPTGRKVAARLGPRELTLHAPHLLDLEVAQVLRRYTLAGVIDNTRSLRALGDLAQLDLQRYSHEILLPRIWSLKDNLTAYDAAYVALAEVLKAPLLTADHKLAKAPGNLAEIEWVS